MVVGELSCRFRFLSRTAQSKASSRHVGIRFGKDETVTAGRLEIWLHHSRNLKSSQIFLSSLIRTMSATDSTTNCEPENTTEITMIVITVGVSIEQHREKKRWLLYFVLLAILARRDL